MTDIEKGHTLENPPIDQPPTVHNATFDSPKPAGNKFLQWTDRVEVFLGLEARGIRRVKEDEKTTKTTLGFMQIAILWFSINTASQNITLASIGQEVYGLGFVDATLCSVFGAILGSIPVAYTAGWGPWSGNRTLVWEMNRS